MKSDPIIQVQDLVKVYTTGVGGFTALKDITFDTYQGEFLGIVGKSGAGKTTLLNAITGVSSITAGKVLYQARANGHGPTAPLLIHTMGENERARWRGRNVGIVYQSFELLPQLDLIDNITMPQDLCGRYGPTVSVIRAWELLGRVELADHAYKLPAQISGGQKQRVAIARALVNDPPLIVADEPTGNLDTVTAEHILQILQALVAQGKTIVMVTHDRGLIPHFSRVIEISDGEIIGPVIASAAKQAPTIRRRQIAAARYADLAMTHPHRRPLPTTSVGMPPKRTCHSRRGRNPEDARSWIPHPVRNDKVTSRQAKAGYLLTISILAQRPAS